MKKIIITSDNFGGEVYAVYDLEGQLISIDFAASNLTAAQKDWIKVHLPVAGGDHLAYIKDCFGGAKSVRILMEGYEVTFDMFWQAYGEKVNRIRCEKRWDKLSKADRQKAFSGLAAYQRHLARNNWQNKANPDTYLMNKYWENEWK